MMQFIPSWLVYLLLIDGFSMASGNKGEIPSDDIESMMNRINKAKIESHFEEVRFETSLGTIIGLEEDSLPPYIANTHYYAFRGIPYAKPPINELRFKDPVEVMELKWPGGTYNATRFGSICPQFDVELKQVFGEEDCLYLNVYTPMMRTDDNNGKERELLPVLVFIHGGAWMRGSSSAHGPAKLLSRNMVVVTLNYRIGMLGFLGTGDSMLPGNYGMLDQIAALRWVQRYISEFGGDPEQVTLGGFSAGAVSVHLHMISSLSEGLFHRSVMMSGSAFCNWAVQEDPQTPAKLFASKLSCPTSPSSALASCVAAKDYREIVEAQAAIFRLEVFPMWVAPVVDIGLRSKPFLAAPVEDLQARPTPLIIGTVPEECLLYSANTLVLAERMVNSPKELYDLVVPESFQPWEDPETLPELHRFAELFYYSSSAKNSKDVLLEELTEALTDQAFTRYMGDTADLLANSEAPVYMYMMTHRDVDTPVLAAPLYQRLWNLGYKSNLLKTGVAHGDDLIHLFSFPGIQKDKMSAGDERVSQMLLTFISNFVIYGKPQTDNGITSDLPLWNKSVPGQPVGYYNISVNPTMIHKKFRNKERNFWKNIVPLVIPKSSPRVQRCDQDSVEESCLSNK